MVARVDVFRQFICNDNNSTKLRLKLKYTHQNQSFVDNFPRQHEQFPPKSTCFSEIGGTTPEMIMRLISALQCCCFRFFIYASFSRHILCPGETIVTQHKRRGFRRVEMTRWLHVVVVWYKAPIRRGRLSATGFTTFFASSSVTKVVNKQAFDSCPSRWNYLNMLNLQQQYNSISMYVWIPKWNLMLSHVFHDKLMRWHLQVTRSHRRLVSCPQTNIQQPLRLGAPINSMIALVTCSVHMKMIVYVALSIHPIYPSVSQHCHFMPCFIIQKTFEENHQIWPFHWSWQEVWRCDPFASWFCIFTDQWCGGRCFDTIRFDSIRWVVESWVDLRVCVG